MEEKRKLVPEVGSYYINDEDDNVICWYTVHDDNIMFESDVSLEELKEIYDILIKLKETGN